MTTKTINIADIKPAPFNPWARTTEGAIKKLKASIEKYGRVLVPVLVDQGMNLIDGHRRVACCKALGITTIEASIVDVSDSSQAWSDVNSTAQNVRTKDWISAYVLGMGVDVMPKRVSKIVSETERLCGEEFIKSIASDGKRGRGDLYSVAKSLSNYVGDDSDKFMKAAIMYMDKRGNQFMMRRAMAACLNPKTLRSKILRNRPIELKIV